MDSTNCCYDKPEGSDHQISLHTGKLCRENVCHILGKPEGSN